MIDSKPDRPEDFIMITLNTDYINPDLYHVLTKKINGNHPELNSTQRKENCANRGLRSFVLYL
jgi:hypothetical protein